MNITIQKASLRSGLTQRQVRHGRHRGAKHAKLPFRGLQSSMSRSRPRTRSGSTDGEILAKGESLVAARRAARNVASQGRSATRRTLGGRPGHGWLIFQRELRELALLSFLQSISSPLPFPHTPSSIIFHHRRTSSMSLSPSTTKNAEGESAELVAGVRFVAD